MKLRTMTTTVNTDHPLAECRNNNTRSLMRWVTSTSRVSMHSHAATHTQTPHLLKSPTLVAWPLTHFRGSIVPWNKHGFERESTEEGSAAKESSIRWTLPRR